MVYVDQKPKFLQNAVAALRGSRRDYDDEEEYYDEDDQSGREREERPEFEVLDPSRPAIPTRPDDDPYRDEDEEDRRPRGKRKAGSDEEDEDEMPQIVVLKEGKHLTKEEVMAEKSQGAQGY
ncbi:hypothetical protein BT69DRAFT_1020537 [Atractiella rhizophila]|nr:hypothetical protein BT69DRAFT_1020537 [Atractiella rhizophila]